MKLKSFFLILLFGASISFSGCFDNDDNTSRVLLKLVDAPGDYKEVNIDLIDILVNSHSDEEGWTSLENVNVGYDDSDLVGPVNVTIGTATDVGTILIAKTI